MNKKNHRQNLKYTKVGHLLFVNTFIKFFVKVTKHAFLLLLCTSQQNGKIHALSMEMFLNLLRICEYQ